MPPLEIGFANLQKHVTDKRKALRPRHSHISAASLAPTVFLPGLQPPPPQQYGGPHAHHAYGIWLTALVTLLSVNDTDFWHRH